jgi:Fe-S cluster assembly protein SufD
MTAIALDRTGNALERYRAAFDARYTEDDALTRLRRAALEEFLALGVPTPRDEAWKYTNLRRFEARSFTPARTARPVDASVDDWIAHGGARIVLIDGHWAATLSSSSAHPPGVTVLSLGQWAQHEPEAAAAFLAERTGQARGAFERLNLAFLTDGVVLELADGAETNEPIYIVHQWSARSQGAMSCPRILVRAGRNSRCTLIEQYLGPADVEYFTNAVAHVGLGHGARVEHYRLQQESTRSFHIGAVAVRLEAQSAYSLHDVALGAGLGRVNIETELVGPAAHVAMHGLIAPTGSQHLDAHTRIDHIAPQTTSVEEYRGVADGRGRGVFNGKVIVRPNAQKVDARQSSRNLLISPTAEIDSKPELEIYANDVKCSHGATTGQLDPTALFYLRSRGVSERDARALLIRAFAESILASIGHPPLRSYLEERLEARFGGPLESSP